MGKLNIKLLTSDIELHTKLNATGLFNQITYEPNLGELDSIDILIVSDRVIKFNEFLDLLYSSSVKNIKHVFYMISNNNKMNVNNVKAVLKAKGINIIPPRFTTSQIVEKICIDVGLNIVTHKNIAVFIGADSKVGTTMCVQSIAEDIVKHTNTKVFLGFFNGNPSNDYIDEDKSYLGIDSIKARIINKILSGDELIDICIKKGNLYILPGANSILDTRHYHPEHIEYLIQLASKVFGLVLIDAGSKLAIGMTIGAINSTINRYLITTQQDNVKRNFDRTVNQIFSNLDYDSKDFFLIVNKFIKSNELYSAAHLAEMYRTTLAGVIPYSEYGWQAERDRKSLLSYDIYEYNQHISEISKLLSDQLNFEYTETVQKRTSFIKRLVLG